MRITQDLRADVVAEGLRQKAAEFKATGQELYARPAGADYSEDLERTEIG
jgi:hypothetical protein